MTLAALRPIVNRVLYAEEQPAHSETNAQGSAIARVVFRSEKPPSFTLPETARVRETSPRAHTRPALVIAATAVFLFIAFALLPEALGDRPYNVFGPARAKAHSAKIIHSLSGPPESR